VENILVMWRTLYRWDT